MTRPTFSMRTVLLLVSLVAVWTATSQIPDYRLATALRSTIWFLFFAFTVLSAVNRRGKSRAFWIGVVFAIVMRSPPALLEPYAPQLNLSDLVLNWAQSNPTLWRFLYETLNLALTTILCIVCGVMSARIYESESLSAHK